MAQDIGILKVEPLDAPLGIAKVEPLEIASVEPLARPETTTLAPPQEAKFQQWVARNKITDVDKPGSFYDYRGYYQEHGDKPIKFGVDHFTDTYKQHGHPTFSEESQYSSGPGDGGRWQGETFIASKAQRPAPFQAAGFSNPDSVKVSTPAPAVPTLTQAPAANPLQMSLAGEGISFDPNTNRATGPYDPRAGFAQVTKGASDLVRLIPGNITRGLRMSTDGPWVDDETKAAASDMIEGAFEIAKPAVALGMANAPLTTLTALGVSATAARGAFMAAKKLGASDESARLAANIAAVGVTGIATHQIMKAATTGVEKVAGDARAVASQVRAFDAAQPPEPVGPTEPVPVGSGGTAAAIASRKGLPPVPPPQLEAGPPAPPAPPPIDTVAALKTLETAAPGSPQGLTAIAALRSAGMSLEDITAAMVATTQTGPRPDAFKPIVVPPRAPAPEAPVEVAKVEPLEETPAPQGQHRQVTVNGRVETVFDEGSKDYAPTYSDERMTEARAELEPEIASYRDLPTEEIHARLTNVMRNVSGWRKYGQPTPADMIRDEELGAELVRRRQEKAKEKPTPSRKKPVAVGDTVKVKGVGTDGKPVVGTYTGTPELNPTNATIETAAGPLEVPREQLTLVAKAAELPADTPGGAEGAAARVAGLAGWLGAKPDTATQDEPSHPFKAGDHVSIAGSADGDPKIIGRFVGVSDRDSSKVTIETSQGDFDVPVAEVSPSEEAPDRRIIQGPSPKGRYETVKGKVVKTEEAEPPAATQETQAPVLEAAKPTIRHEQARGAIVIDNADAVTPAQKVRLQRAGFKPSRGDGPGSWSIKIGAHAGSPVYLKEHDRLIAKAVEITGAVAPAPNAGVAQAPKPAALKPAETLTTKDGTQFTVQPLAPAGTGEKFTKPFTGRVDGSIRDQVSAYLLERDGKVDVDVLAHALSSITTRAHETSETPPSQAPPVLAAYEAAKEWVDKDRAAAKPAAPEVKKPAPSVFPSRKTSETAPRTEPGVLAAAVDVFQHATLSEGRGGEWVEITDKQRARATALVKNEQDVRDPNKQSHWHVEGISQRRTGKRNLVTITVRTYDPKTGKPESEKGQPYRLQMPAGYTLKKEDGNAETPVSPSDRATLADASPEDGEAARAEGAPGESGGARSGADVGGRSEPDSERSEPTASAGDDGPGVGVSAERDGRPVAPERAPKPVARDHVIERGAELATGGERTRVKANLDAIATLKRIEGDGRQATDEERATLAKFVGWGGLSGVFKEGHKDHAAVKAALTDEEYRAAARSTPNAHYTSPVVIASVYDALERFGVQGPVRFLEPSAGVGHFLGLMPADLAAGATRTAVELDPISGRITQALYPNARVHVQGLQEAPVRQGGYDLVVSNVPFGDYGVHDKAFKGRPKSLSSSIHNYFFVKAVDLVRPGGIIAFITSHFTMDAVDQGVRDYLGRETRLLGAIRLPNTAFKQNAGTEVVTDIIFLQKNGGDSLPANGGSITRAAWQQTSETKIGDGTFHVSNFFLRNPQMVLGTPSSQGSQYAANEYTVEASGDLAAQLAEAVGQLPTNVYVRPTTKATHPTIEQQLPAADAPTDISEGAWFLDDKGKLHVKERGQAVAAKLSPEAEARVRGMMKVRDALRTTMKAMLSDATDADIKAEQRKLNTVYDKFVQRHGYIAKRANIKAFHEDNDIDALLALEEWTPKAEKPEKAGIFTKRVLRPPTPVTHVDSGKEALLVTLNETGRVDWSRMASLTGRTAEDLQEELQGRVFHDPQTNTWEEADRYLSGNVKAKLKAAQAAGAKYAGNVKALEAVQPADLEPSDISVRLGSPWVPEAYVGEFARHLGLGGLRYHYSPGIARWTANEQRFAQYRYSTANTEQWGTNRRPAHDIILTTLNLGDPLVSDKVRQPDGSERTVVDQAQTVAAREKQQAIQDEFKAWVWAEPARATALARIYNDTMNTSVAWEPNGDHLTLEGASPLIKFRPHQRNFIWRGLQQPNNLAHHVVGAGKTFAAIALAMEKRRLGLARKPLVTVPNHLPAQWAKDVRRLYPAAKVLFSEKKDFKPENRRRLLNRIATGDWDIVILPYTHFGRIPLKDETFNAFLQKELDGLEVELERSRRELGKKDPSTKELEKAKLRLESKMRKAKDEGVKDDTIKFEDLGVDMLIVDEAHNFKNLYFPTKMTRVAGVPTQGSNRAFDAYIKIKYLESTNRTGGTNFLTGTPISNTMAEMFVLLRYLAQPMLDERGIPQFDGWAATFGEKVTAFEISPTGKGFRQKTRFARFTNMPELMQMYRAIADVQTADMLKLPTPPLKGAKAQLHAVPASTELTAFVDGLLDRYEHVLGLNGKSKPDPREDNALKITTDGRKAALDLRLVDVHQPAGGKIDLAGKEIHAIWQREAKRRGAQLVFSDLGAPSDEAAKFTVYQALKEKLIAMGIPAQEIAFIHDANTDPRKVALFAAVQNGDVRVLIGSTEKMGAGTNVQDRLVALHHLDAPWRPSDIEQREGRILRQGNLFGDKELGSKEYDPKFEVEIHTYLSEGSFDAYLWQLLESKARFIMQALKGDTTSREIDDADDVVMSFGAAKAVATGNPAIMEHAKAQSDLARLEISESNFGKRRWRLQKQLASLPDEIERAEVLQADAKTLMDARTLPAERKDFGVVTPGGLKTGDDGTAIVLAALEKSRKGRREVVDGITTVTPWVKVGKVAGLEVSVSTKTVEWKLSEPTVSERWKIEAGDAAIVDTATIGPGALSSLWHLIKNEPNNQAASAAKTLERLRADQDVAQSEVAKPYQHAGAIKTLRDKIKRLEGSLNLDAESLAREAAAAGTIVTTKEEDKADADAERAKIAAEEGDDEPADAPDVKSEKGAVTLAPLVLAVEEAKKLSDFLRFVAAPDTRTNESRAGAGTLRAEVATRDHHLARFQTLVDDIEKVMDGWSKDESLEFWDVMQGLAPATNLTPDRQVVAQTFRDALDFWTKEVVSRGLIKTYLEHYWPQEWVKPSGGFAGILANVFGRRPIQGPESFRKHRTIPSTREGVETFGLEPVSWNPATQMIRKIAEMANSVKAYDMRLGLKRQGLMKYVPEGSKWAYIKDGKLPRGWVLYPDNFIGTVEAPPTVKVPFGRLVAGHYYGPKEVVQLVKNHLSPGLMGKSKLFDGIRQLSALHTQLLLGWSGFHMWLTGWEAVASKQSLALDLLQRGKFKEAALAQLQVGPQGVVRDWLRGRQAVKEYYENDVDPNRALTINMVDQIIQAGGGVGWSRLEHQNAPNAVARNVRGAVGAAKRGDLGEAAGKAAKALALTPFAAIALPTQVVMRHWVPYLKVAAFLDMAKMELETLGPTATLDERRRRLGEVWDTVDNRFGLLRYDNLFWNNAFKDAMTSTIRAVGFTGGTFREFGGAPTAQWKRILDNLTPPAGSSPGGPKGPGGPPPSTPDPFAMPDEHDRPWIHPKTLHLFSTLIVIMLGGALVMVLKSGKVPKDLHDLLHPENGEIDPVTGDPRREDLISYLRTLRSWGKHPFRAAASSVQSLYTSILEALMNEDSGGTEVRNPDDPFLRQLLEGLEHVAKAALPIPIQNAERLATGTDSVATRAKAAALQAIEPTVPTSAESQRTDMEQYLRDIAPPMHRTQEQAEKGRERRTLREAVRTTPKGQPIPKTDTSHLSPGAIKDTVKKAGQAATLYGISRASFAQALKAYELATEDERYQIRGAVMKKLPAALSSTPKEERVALMARYRDVMGLPYTKKK